MYNLNISGIPDILTVPYDLTKTLHDLPVIVLIELVAMSPYRHQIQILPLVQCRKGLAMLDQMIVMVTGHFPLQPIPWQSEATSGSGYYTRIFDSERRKDTHYILVI